MDYWYGSTADEEAVENPFIVMVDVNFGVVMAMAVGEK